MSFGHAAAVVFGDGSRNGSVGKQAQRGNFSQQRARSLSPSRSPPRKAEHTEEDGADAIEHDEEFDMTSPEERLTSLSVRCFEFEQNEQYAELVTARIHSLALVQLCFGKYDEEVTLAYCRLARAYLRQRLYTQAEAHAMHALERLAASSHDNADEIRVSTLSTLGQAHVGQRKYSRAQPLLSEALTLQQRLLDSTNADGGDGGAVTFAATTTKTPRPSEYALNELCEILQTLSIVATHKKRYEEAVEWLERVWEARESALGPKHVSLLGIYVRLGRAYLSLDASSGADRATAVFKRAIAVALASDTGVTTHDVGSALFGLGSAMLLLDRHNEALPHLERSLKIFKTVHGAKCVHVQRVLRQMALVHVKNKSYAAADKCLLVCVKAERHLHSANSPQLAEMQSTRGDVFTLSNQFARAKKCFVAASKIYEVIHGAEHRRVAQLKSRIQRVEQLESGQANLPTHHSFEAMDISSSRKVDEIDSAM